MSFKLVHYKAEPEDNEQQDCPEPFRCQITMSVGEATTDTTE